VDALVLAAGADSQLPLAAAACAAGKRALVLQPVPVDPLSWRAAASAATQRQRQLQVGRATAFALAAGGAQALVKAGAAGLEGAEIRVLLTAPAAPSGPTRAAELLDEIDFGQALLGGTVVRHLAVGGPGVVPGRAFDRLWRFDLVDDRGARRGLGLHLTCARGPRAPKRTQIVLRGPGGAAALTGAPLEGGPWQDLRLFLSSLDGAAVGDPGLSAARLADLAAQFGQALAT
jgi:hypothetical protein